MGLRYDFSSDVLARKFICDQSRGPEGKCDREIDCVQCPFSVAPAEVKIAVDFLVTYYKVMWEDENEEL